MIKNGNQTTNQIDSLWFFLVFNILVLRSERSVNCNWKNCHSNAASGEANSPSSFPEEPWTMKPSYKSSLPLISQAASAHIHWPTTEVYQCSVSGNYTNCLDIYPLQCRVFKYLYIPANATTLCNGELIYTYIYVYIYYI